MSSLSKAERDKLDVSDFADPKLRLFPILDQDDVDSAARLIGKAHDPDGVRKRVTEIARAKKLKIPDAWEKAAMGTATVDFCAEPGTRHGKTVVRKAPVLFQAGSYPDKQYDMSPEEILAAVRDFSAPVPLTDTHNDATSVFKGKLGCVTKLAPTADYSQLGAEVEVPAWFDDLFAGQPLPLSARWDRETKRLVDVAVLTNPRVSQAAMFAAFAADAAGADPERVKKVTQYVHDLTAAHGAGCPETAPSPMHSNFASGNPIQDIHDMALGAGASCAIYKDGMATNKEWKPGQYYQTVADSMPAYKDYRPGQYASMSAAFASGVVTPAPVATPAPAPAKSAREVELERQLETERLARDLAEAAAFAASVLAGHHALPRQRATIELDYRQAARDDRALGGTVTFADDAGRERAGTRVDALKARWLGQDPHVLTQELLAANGTPTGATANGQPATVAFHQTVTPGLAAELEAARKDAEVYAVKRMKVVRGNQAPAGHHQE